MSIHDPISNLLTVIRNGYLAKKKNVIVHSSNLLISIVNLLSNERFLDSYLLIKDDCKKPKIKIFLKYFNKDFPMIRKITRISKPGFRVYKSKDNIPVVSNGFGLAVISTSLGLLTDKKARKLGVGGELLFIVE